jgi:hypothetical protein
MSEQNEKLYFNIDLKAIIAKIKKIKSSLKFRISFCKIGVHSWDKWEDVKDGKVYQREHHSQPSKDWPTVGVWYRQKRYCSSCGKIELRTINEYTIKNNN